MVIPGTLWTAIFIVLSLLPTWLEQSFPGAVWLTPIVGAILIIVKVWQVYRPSDAPDAEFESAPGSASQEASKTSRVLFG
jgi:hypothetical protein